ncbi:MAG: fibrobacter succinogenes major paralogous domain-containing protein [Bacteroidales bacterium]|nr:fibrobacter succinogenes major paralogous domain-containing protein [Bacteroidales bacterium]
MNTIPGFEQSVWHHWCKTLMLFLSCSLILIISSCQKYDDVINDKESMDMQDFLINPEITAENCKDGRTIFYGHKIFIRHTGAPVVETQNIENTNFECFDGNFILKIKNGCGKRSRVSSAEIKINGVFVVGPSDFSKNVTFISKPLTGLSPVSVLEVKLNGAPGSFIDLWIEGAIILAIPTFTQIGPLPLNSVAPELPAISDNGISGTWDPETINTNSEGSFTFTFTPDDGQCANSTSMKIYIGIVSDIEGNVYKIAKIGDQLWLAENLKTSRYNNGDLISTTNPVSLDISGEYEPKYQWAYDGNADTYGRYYTWYAVTDSRGVCPTGWHVPTDDDWTLLTDYLINNGFGYEGSGSDIAKALAAKSGWNPDATPGNIGNDMPTNNSSGFSALPGGVRVYDGTFNYIGIYALWWSSTEINTTLTWNRNLYSPINYLRREMSKKIQGANIRCIKD